MTDKLIITADQAESVLPEGDTVHNYMQAGPTLLGVDYPRQKAIEAIRSAVQIEIGGEGCKGMGHGLVVWDTAKSYSFFEADSKKLEELELAQSS